jgi:molecular chaperone GrpE (heat shock protein)
MDELAQSQADKDLVAKHEQELKEYRLKDKIHRFKEILAPMIKDTKKLEESATEYAKDNTITEKFLTKIVEDSLLIVSTSASEKKDNESKNYMMTLADSMVISTSSVNVRSDKPLRNFNK